MSFVDNNIQKPKAYGNEAPVEQDPLMEDWGLDDPYGDEFAGSEDEFSMGDEGGDPFSGEGEMGGYSVGSARDQIDRLLKLLEESEVLNDTKKAAIEAEIKVLKNKINQVAFKEGEALQLALSDISSEMAVLETRITGIDPTTGEQDPSFVLSNQVEETLEAVKNNENLNDKDREDFIEKLEKILLSLETPGMGEIDSLQEQFDLVKEEFDQKSMHPAVINSLADYTGLDPEALDKLFDKHNIDPNNLPKPPDSTIAALLNDPEFSSSLSSLFETAGKKYSDLTDEIRAQEDAAIAWNQGAVSTDTSTVDNIPGAFRDLWEMSNREDDLSQALTGARKDAATEVAKILSAIYGEEVTAVDDPEKAGMITFNGQELNVMSEGGNEKVAFGNTAPEWPHVELVPVSVDDGGDGQTQIPSWMRSAHYPYNVYDYTGGATESDKRGAAGGEWNWSF